MSIFINYCDRLIHMATCTKEVQNAILPTDNKEIISRPVDTRSFGGDVSVSDDDFTKSTVEVLASPLLRKLTTLACMRKSNSETN